MPDELRALFDDWFSAQSTVIDEYGAYRDYRGLIEKAERRAAALGIAWTHEDAPPWMTEFLDED